ncbi:type IV pilin N-terminal domain-containing protein [Methanospirillum sp.]|uniref:type IV pilin N-terminal domain-containing protein n=1 Tax=Methanospirillum sp. TaxID=45200 RepID=UPI0035A0AA34
MIAVRKDEAVSPVVGILLMLVVTIIIAAVVSGFAGSLTSDQTKAPQVSLEVKGIIQNISDTDTTNYKPDHPAGFEAANGLEFVHKGGDSFALSDVYLRLQSGSTSAIVDVGNVINLSATCLPNSVTSYIMEIGDNDGFIKPGDKFIVYADDCRIDDMGSQISWKPEGALGGFGAYLGTKCEYKLIDKASDKVMQQGSFVLQ